MKDQVARDRIESVYKKEREDFNYWLEHFMKLSSKLDLLMTHLNLEFEDIKPGIRVRKKR